MIHSEMRLESIDSRASSPPDTGVVDQDVVLHPGVDDFARSLSYLLQGTKVEEEGSRRPSRSIDLIDDLAQPIVRSCRDYNLEAAFCQGGGGCSSNPR